METTHFATALLRWYEKNGRELPWRNTRDPYAIWLSEVILQQTRVQQGRDYWQRFMQRFPTVESLAAATQDEVLKLWQGLGYYSRARNLHAAARQIVARGGFPTTRDELRSLRGVGDYTSAAVASLAFDEPVAVVDGNVFRVLARYYALDTPIDTTQGKRHFQALAQELLPPAAAATYNQAIMDFGALVCTPAAPRCDECPVATTCAALRHDAPTRYPVKSRKTAVALRRLCYIYARYDGKAAFRRRPAGDIWQGLWEPLLIEGDTLPPLAGTVTLLRRGVRHVLTHRVLVADFYLLECDDAIPLPAGYRWVDEARIDDLAVPRLVERLLSLVNRE